MRWHRSVSQNGRQTPSRVDASLVRNASQLMLSRSYFALQLGHLDKAMADFIVKMLQKIGANKLLRFGFLVCDLLLKSGDSSLR
jgi:hypothetical protein